MNTPATNKPGTLINSPGGAQAPLQRDIRSPSQQPNGAALIADVFSYIYSEA